jgi:hypothetical protein
MTCVSSLADKLGLLFNLFFTGLSRYYNISYEFDKLTMLTWVV